MTVTFSANANAITTTTLASSLNPSTYGSNVTFTASVKVGVTAVTTGSVTFIEGGDVRTTHDHTRRARGSDGSGQAVFATATLTVPSHIVTACYGGAAGFNSSSGSVTQTVNKANATVVVNGYTGVYDGAAHGATGTVVGVAADPTAAGSSLNLGASFTNVPGGTANWTFTGGTNYNDQSGTAAIVINKADATVTVTGYTGIYDGAAHGATGTATGVGRTTALAAA